MHKFFMATICCALALSCVSFSSTGLSNEISNIQFQNATQTSVDVVWTTVHPSTSQVLLARDTNYETERQIPAIADPNLVTTHRVTVGILLPGGTYYIYVASTTA
ncbi:MAG TPA: fibronectin type III domain-containing protein, partial [Candidatus Methylomirabilis sp.]|nr:fibronectin type III domain-containing protein [Candidatus Methylomirabilis sp.]